MVAAPLPRGRRVVPARIWVGIAGLLAGVAMVLWVTLQPNPVDAQHREFVAQLIALLHSAGIPSWVGYRHLEFAANILMFVPMGFFVALLMPLRLGWASGLIGTGFSILIETVQFVALPARFASLLDVVANSTGAWIGVAIAVLLRVAVAARDKRLRAEFLLSR